MLTDRRDEKLITMPEAALLVPRAEAQRAPSAVSLYRWATLGCKGIVLESVRSGGKRFTTAEAVRRFLEKLNEPKRGAAGAIRPVRERIDAGEKAGEEFDRISGRKTTQGYARRAR